MRPSLQRACRARDGAFGGNCDLDARNHCRRATSVSSTAWSMALTRGRGSLPAVPLSAALLVMVAALLHAGWNLLAKRARDPFAFLWIAMALALVWLGPLALLRHPESLSLAVLPLVVSGIVHGIYFATLGEAYRSGELSTVYPIARGLGVGLAPLLAIWVSGEWPSLQATLGIATIVIAIFSLARVTPGAAPRNGRGTWLAIATGPLIAIYSVVDHLGVASADPVPYLAATNAGALIVSAPLAWRRRAGLTNEWRTNKRALAFAACTSLTAYLLVLYAFRLAPAAYVVAMRETSIVVATIFGRLWLGETITRRRGAAVASIAVGAAVIALA
jgi:drug/metabolite transporter (DMT)-like permease